MRNSAIRFVVLACTFISFLAACKKSSQTSTTSSANVIRFGDQPAVKNDWLVLSTPANPTTLNPILSSDAYAQDVQKYVFDYLIRFDPATGEPVGQLAESWKISDDGLNYEFKIRENATFHDGKPVTAEDVKFTFDQIKNPKVDAAHLQNYFNGLESVEVLGPKQVRVKMKERYFRNLIVLGLAEILPKHIYSVGDFNKNPANRAPVGSGPYQFVKWDNGRSIELKRFESYWGKDDPVFKGLFNFNKVLIRVITEESVEVMALKKGDIDGLEPVMTVFLNDLSGPEVEKNFYRLNFKTVDGNGYSYIGWDMSNPFFASKKVRQALAHAMPREEINTKIYQNQRALSVGQFPAVSPKSDPSITPRAYDLDKARTLLAEEGWIDSDRNGLLEKDGKEFKFELLFPSGNAEGERIALIYQQSLKNLGVEMNIRTLEWTVFIKNLNDRKFNAFMMSWGSSLDSDPFQIWHSSQATGIGSNRVGFKNARADQILEEARSTLDREKRNELYREFARILHDEAPYLFLFERAHLYVLSKRIAAVEPIGILGLDNPRWFVPFGQERYKESAQ